MRVVLDANVFVSALIRPEGPPGQVVFLLSDDPRPFELVLSTPLADEIHEALGYPRVRKALRSAEIDPNDWFSNYELLADFVEPAVVVGVAPDPDDDKILGTALGGRADFIITGDAGLLGLGTYEDIPIINPARFLRDVLKIRGR